MFFRLVKYNPLAGLWCGIVLLGLFSPLTAAEKQPSLTVNPSTCVTLEQGRNCYSSLTFQWQSSIKSKYCLYQDAPRSLIRCWQDGTRGSVEWEFENNSDTTYVLLNHQQQVANATVKVNWVRKESGRKKRWRVF